MAAVLMPWRYNQQNNSCCSVKKYIFIMACLLSGTATVTRFLPFFQAYIFTRFKEVQRSIYLLLASIIYTFILLHRLSLHVLQLDQVKLICFHNISASLGYKVCFVPYSFLRKPRVLNPLRSLCTCASQGH